MTSSMTGRSALNDVLPTCGSCGVEPGSNNASPLVILAVLHEELTKRGDRVYNQVS